MSFRTTTEQPCLSAASILTAPGERRVTRDIVDDPGRLAMMMRRRGRFCGTEPNYRAGRQSHAIPVEPSSILGWKDRLRNQSAGLSRRSTSRSGGAEPRHFWRRFGWSRDGGVTAGYLHDRQRGIAFADPDNRRRRTAPKFVTIGYGDRQGYERTELLVRDAVAHDAKQVWR